MCVCAGTALLYAHSDTRDQACSLEDAVRAAHCRSIARGDGTGQVPKHQGAAMPLQTANAVPGAHCADPNAAAPGNGSQQPVLACVAGPSTLRAAVPIVGPMQDAPASQDVTPLQKSGVPPQAAGSNSGIFCVHASKIQNFLLTCSIR